MKLSELKPKIKKRKKKRVGRGSGSGKGTYSGRGIKGQKARSGFKIPPSPFIAKIPKLRGEGFIKIKNKEIAVVNLRDLDKKFKTGEEVSLKSLIEKGLIKPKKGQSIKTVKILGGGKLSKKLKFAKDLLFSKTARAYHDNKNVQ
jgi:large subunit ribosomal protein L15